MSLTIIGLGLFGEKDITVRGLEKVKQADFVYMEYYTSILGVSQETLEAFYEKKITLADREMIESEFEEEILSKAVANKVALLVVGDPFSATTHMDLYTRAIKEGVSVEVIHNASIMNSCGLTGLSLYRFGETISVPFFTETWRPMSFYDKLAKNAANGLHTLCLLDIKVKEISDENLALGKKIYEKPRFMTVNEGLDQLLQCEESKKEGWVTEDALCFGLARVGAPDQIIRSGTVSELLKSDFGGPLHSIIICGKEMT